MSVCCECCVLSGRGLCNELITLPEESYRLWCVVVCDVETSWMRRSWPTGGCWPKTNKHYIPVTKLYSLRPLACWFESRQWLGCLFWVLSGRCLCDGPITSLEESYRVWCIWVWSRILNSEEVLVHWGLFIHYYRNIIYVYLSHFLTSDGVVEGLSYIFATCGLWWLYENVETCSTFSE